MACRRPAHRQLQPRDGQGIHGHHRRALPSTLMKLLDDDGREVTTLGQSGEIAIKGPQVMAATGSALTKPPRS